MTWTNQNFDCYRGDTVSVPITMTEADGSPFDATLPGLEIKWRLAKTPHASDAESLARKELGNGITAGVGTVTLTLGVEDTDLLPGLYYHELKVYQAGDVATALTGWVIIRRALRMGNVVEPLVGTITMSETAPTVS